MSRLQLQTLAGILYARAIRLNCCKSNGRHESLRVMRPAGRACVLYGN